jgi:hypothetical protein
VSGVVSGNVEANQEEVNRITESVKKAAQIAGQSAHSKKINANLAQFLVFLLNILDANTFLIEKIFATFFVTTQPEKNIVEYKKDINTEMLVGCFAPLFPAKIAEMNLLDMYNKYYDFHSPVTLSKYLHAIKGMMHAFNGYQTLQQIQFTECITSIIASFPQVFPPTQLPSSKGELGQQIVQSLWR